MAKLTYEQVKSVLKYDPETGKLFWKERPMELFKTARACSIWNKRFPGNEAFTSLETSGCKSGSIFGKNYKAHRIAWLLANGVWPSGEIDHINGDPSDNRLCNLRDVTHGVNMKNQKRHITNTSGVGGVHWHNGINRWVARATINGLPTHLGAFLTYEEALAARSLSNIENGFTDRHGS